MGFKDLFFVSEETPNDKPKTEPINKTDSFSFPSEEKEAPVAVKQTSSIFGSSPVQPTYVPPVASNVTQEHVEKALDLYQKGFDSLNQTGFDFYEFYQSVMSAGVGNPQIYGMAYSMGSAMDKTLSKEKLIQQADYYTGEILKQYEDFVNKGNSKKQEVENQKSTENQSLVSELDSMKQQLDALSIQIADREKKLSAIGEKYNPQLNEINNKISANLIAKDKIINSISEVKNGILTNIK